MKLHMDVQMKLHVELQMELHMGLHVEQQMELHMELQMELHMELHIGAPQHMGLHVKVLQGPGIGLLHAGDVEVAVFYSMVEKPLLEQDAYENGEMAKWYRFRTDMCFIITRRGRFGTSLGKVGTLAKCFELKLEEVSTEEFRFLDMTLKRDANA